MIFECKLCNYKTERKTNYNRHLLSKNHIYNELVFQGKKIPNKKTSKNEFFVEEDNEKGKKKYLHNFAQFYVKNIREKGVEEIFECEYCNKNFVREFSLKRHYRVCKDKKIYEEKMKRELEMKDKEIKELRENIKYHKKLTISAGNLMNKQLNTTILYLTNKFPDAPPLEPINEMDLQKLYINDERIKEIETLNNVDIDEKELYDIKNNLKKIEIGKNLTYNFLLGRFVNEIVNVIQKLYKKDDPTKQSTWTTDISRKSYYIKDDSTKQIEEDFKELIEKDLNDFGWMYDPQGSEFKSRTIDPLMNFIKNYAEAYHDFLVDKLQKKNSDSINIAIEIGNVCSLLLNIKNKKYEKEIISQITPIFHLNKNIETI